MTEEDKKLNGIAERYFEIKALQKDLEQELSGLREQILESCGEQDLSRVELDHYVIKLVAQQRREYDGDKLYKALPDLELWRMLSRPDSSKIASLIKLKVVDEERIQDTYTLKNVTMVQVDKR